MRILLDNCVNQRIGKHIRGHEVVHARQKGWADLSNGRLIQAAESDAFDVLITVDKSIRQQTNLEGRKLILITIDSYSIVLEALIPFIPELERTLAELDSKDARSHDILISVDRC